MIAALLHDVGHGPFSHASEPLMEARLGRTHDDIAGIAEEQFGALLEPLGINPSEVCAIVKGSHRLSGIIHGDLDVDRMDYLLRDAYYTGAPYGTVDAHRLIRNIHLTPEGIVLDENGVSAAESLLIARTLMRPSVYYHHVSRIGECMFQLAVLAHMATGPAGGLEHICALDDGECMHELKNSKSPLARKMAGWLYKRRLYKRAVYAGQDQVNAAAFQAGWPVERAREVAGEIAGQSRVPAERRTGGHPSDPRGDVTRGPGEKPARRCGVCRTLSQPADPQPDPARAVAAGHIYAPRVPRCRGRCRSRDPAHKKAHPPGYPLLIADSPVVLHANNKL